MSKVVDGIIGHEFESHRVHHIKLKDLKKVFFYVIMYTDEGNFIQ